MTLGLEHAVKLLEEHIEILKQNLRFFVANYKVEYASKIITIKRELDKAVQERMKLSEIYYCPNINNNRVAVSAAA
jgi:sulfur relay (sulfurtransferase) DsrC/TusE family protein